MDILHLVDRLEELFNESRPIPLTHNVIVDEDRMLDLIDQMRVAIPDEVKKAQQVLSQRDRLMAQAQEEANRTLTLAREKSEGLVEQSAIAEAARIRAREIEQDRALVAESIEGTDLSRRDVLLETEGVLQSKQRAEQALGAVCHRGLERRQESGEPYVPAVGENPAFVLLVVVPCCGGRARHENQNRECN